MEFSPVQRRLNFFLQCRKIILQHLIEVYNLAVYVIYDFNFWFLLCKEDRRPANKRLAVQSVFGNERNNFLQ